MDKVLSLTAPLDTTGGQQGLVPYDLSGGRRKKKRKKAEKRGTAETLRRYWAEGEGAAKIRWGEPGDFERCVRHVSKYMPGRAEGYCNLLHHRALGFYPATHAAMERGKAFGVSFLDSGSQIGLDGTMAINKVGPHGYEHGWIKVGGESPGKGHIRDNGDGSFDVRPAGGYAGHTVSSPGVFSSTQARAEATAARPVKGDTLVGTGADGKQVVGIHDGGSGTHVTLAGPGGMRVRVPKATARRPTAAENADMLRRWGQKVPVTKARKDYSKGPDETVECPSCHRFNAPDACFCDQCGNSLPDVAFAGKSARNPRETGTGRFRTFQGEVEEANKALSEGRHNDAVDLLGSARALAKSHQDRTIVDGLQRSIAVQHGGSEQVVVPSIVKVGPHGYEHGWIKVGGAFTDAEKAASEKADRLTAEAHRLGTPEAHQKAYRAHRAAVSKIRDHVIPEGMTSDQHYARGQAVKHHLDSADLHTKSVRSQSAPAPAKSVETANREAAYLRRYGQILRGDRPGSAKELTQAEAYRIKHGLDNSFKLPGG